MSQYVVWALLLGFLYLFLRAYSLGRQVRDLTERVDDVARRARDFERRYEQDVERSREAVKLEIQSALHVFRKQQDEGAAPADPQRDRIIETLRTVFDPEIPVNIYELGLVYDIIVDADAVVGIRMTLTAPACPAAQTLPVEVEYKLRQIPGVADVKVDIVWDPPWDRDKMSDAAKLALGMY